MQVPCWSSSDVLSCYGERFGFSSLASRDVWELVFDQLVVRAVKRAIAAM